MEDDANTLRGVLEFDGKEVRDLIAHAVSCDRFQITFEERIEIYGEGKWEPQTGEENRDHRSTHAGEGSGDLPDEQRDGRAWPTRARQSRDGN